MDEQKIIDFFNYLHPIVNGCSGFIKTDGYMVHIPGYVIMMDVDETFCSIINIPCIYDIYTTAKINTFLSIKEECDMKLENLYFLGWNIKNQHLMRYYNTLIGIESKTKCVYLEPDCYNINGFAEAVSKSSISHVDISDGTYIYRIPAGKPVTPLTKSDSASLQIYDNIDYHDLKTIRYSVYKKKFKLTVDIFANILTV